MMSKKMNISLLVIGLVLLSFGLTLIVSVTNVSKSPSESKIRIQTLREEVSNLNQKNLKLKAENKRLREELEEIERTITIHEEEGLVVKILPAPELVTGDD